MSDNNLSQKKQKQYEEYVKAVTPVHSLPLNMCKAFFTGGVICVVGQVILNYADNLGLDKDTAGSWCSLILILFSVILTGCNLYSKIGRFGGAGSLVPITGFANSVASSAIEYKAEGYDSNKLLDYVYARGGEPTIPSRKGAKFERHCDWWLYKERHLVEKYFLKLKAFRRIATRYDKLAATYLGFICIASILIWLK